MSQNYNQNLQPPNNKIDFKPPKNKTDLKQMGFDNLLFWSYFLSVNYPCAYLEEADCTLFDLIGDVLPVDTEWIDAFTQYYDGVMENSDGYLEEPTTFTAPISDSEILKIEFHPGDTIFYINDEEIGCTGPHWNLWNIPYQKVKSLLSLENGAVLFQLLLPMTVLEPGEETDLKPILYKQFQVLGFPQTTLPQIVDCLISGIVSRD